MMTMEEFSFSFDGKKTGFHQDFFNLLRFRITDKGEKDVSFVYASRANDHIPSVSQVPSFGIRDIFQLVIDFYESKLTWHKQYRVSKKKT